MKRSIGKSTTRAAFAVLLSWATWCTAHAQPAPQHFDIYTVKPNKGGGNAMSMQWHDNTFTATHVTLKFMMQVAYSIRQAAMEQVPKWGESDYWDIQGKVSEYDAEQMKKMTPEQRRVMQQDFLEHAFGLRVHHETRVQPIYELVVGKDGSKMPENTIDPKSHEAKGKVGAMSMNGERLDGTGLPVETIAKALEGVVERNIVDKTGLPGRYDVSLHWRQEGIADRPDSDVPDIYTALQEQLGLKLQSAKGPADILVVDNAHLPEVN